MSNYSSLKFPVVLRRTRLLVYVICLALCIVLPRAGAQDDAANEAKDKEEATEPVEEEKTETATVDSTSKKPPETLLEMIVAGGTLNIAFMVGLGLFSLVGVSITLERMVNLTRGKIIPADFVRELQDLVRANESSAERFRAVCQRSSSPISNILKAALLRAGRPITEVEKSMEDAVAREMAVLRSRIRPLSVVASVAPLVGLLGTVVGMIMAFRMASQAGLGKAELLAEGIYLALETTVAGLVIAIPCLLFAAMFNSRSEKFMREIDVVLMDTLPCFDQMESTTPSRHATGGNPLMSGKKG